MQKSKILTYIVIVVFLAFPQSSYGWNATGHRMVARIAWDNLDSTVQQKIVALLMQAPIDSCLRQLFQLPIAGWNGKQRVPRRHLADSVLHLPHRFCG